MTKHCALVSSTALQTTQRMTVLDKITRNNAWQHNFVNGDVTPEEWHENFRMSPLEINSRAAEAF